MVCLGHICINTLQKGAKDDDDDDDDDDNNNNNNNNLIYMYTYTTYQDSQCTYNVTLRSVCATNAAVKKQLLLLLLLLLLHILGVCKKP
jgi:hypothetical protein